MTASQTSRTLPWNAVLGPSPSARRDEGAAQPARAGKLRIAWDAASAESTLVDVLRARAAASPDQLLYSFVGAGGELSEATFAGIERLARAIAATLQETAPESSRALLLYPPGIAFIAAYLGCLYAGVTAVPCYPPGLTRASARAVQRIAADCDPATVLTLEAWRADPNLKRLLDDSGTQPTWIGTDAIDPARASHWREPSLSSRSLAFLQYTSGSTGDPKGVMVTHGSLMANLELIRTELCFTASDHGAIWLPPYHDMGLIGGILSPLYSGFAVSLMPPASFLRRPLKWLRTISDTGATIAGGPNFAYDMCTKAAEAAGDADLGLDLSRWEIAFNGAEMVQPGTIERFCIAFARYGFRAEAVTPCYGMAETTLLCTLATRGRGLIERRVDRRWLDEANLAVAPKAPPSAQSRERRLAGCGVAPAKLDVRIVDPETCLPCCDGKVGEVWVSGASIAAGYWNRAEQSQRVFEARLRTGEGGRFLRTGDRGFIDKGELFITGRYRSFVIVRGRNFSAEDLEASACASRAALKPGRCVAFGAHNDSREQLVISVEADPKLLRGQSAETAYDEICAAVRRQVLTDHGVDVDTVLVLKPGATPMTTSGKLKRDRCRDEWLAGELAVVFTSHRGEAGVPQRAPAAAAPAETILAKLQALVRARTGKTLGAEDALETLALDSLQAVELGLELADAFGFELPPTLLAPHATLSGIARWLQASQAGAQAQTPSAAVQAPLVQVQTALAEVQTPSAVAQIPLAAGPTSSATAQTPLMAVQIPSVPAQPPLEARLAQHEAEFRRLRDSGLLCYGLVQTQAPSPTELVLDGQVLQVFSSYSYLGLTQHPAVIEAKLDAVRRHGSGAHAVMLLGGYTDTHRALERRLAAVFATDDAILYSSGFAANTAAIDALMNPGDTIYCDMLVHKSIQDGCRLSGAQVHMFPHQDANALERMLARRGAEGAALVIVDGVYSLRGEIADLPSIARVAHAHGALLMVDEAHALGAIGARGRGTAEHHALEGHVDIVTGGLGKAIPAYGGYVATRRNIAEYLRYRSNPYVFSGGMDSANAAAALAALDLLDSDASLMPRLAANIGLMQRELVARGIPSLRWGSPCMPVVCGEAEAAYALSAEMRKRGFYIAPITYPAVPRTQQGLRLTVTAAHDAAQIRACASALEEALSLVSPTTH